MATSFYGLSSSRRLDWMWRMNTAFKVGVPFEMRRGMLQHAIPLLESAMAAAIGTMNIADAACFVQEIIEYLTYAPLEEKQRLLSGQLTLTGCIDNFMQHYDTYYQIARFGYRQQQQQVAHRSFNTTYRPPPVAVAAAAAAANRQIRYNPPARGGRGGGGGGRRRRSSASRNVAAAHEPGEVLTVPVATSSPPRPRDWSRSRTRSRSRARSRSRTRSRSRSRSRSTISEWKESPRRDESPLPLSPPAAPVQILRRSVSPKPQLPATEVAAATTHQAWAAEIDNTLKGFEIV